ncbi:MAG: polyhydroxyalkanoate synthesis repressor PhaR [Paracoccaceae bacterium]
MAEKTAQLLIKRYASRRLYNTETSDYVTLDDIAGFIRAGREVQIIDLKSGDDLTRQYMLQIIAEHEGRGESVLPIEVLTDLVRGYTSDVQSVVPQFLAMSFEMLRDGPNKVMENLPGPMASMPGFEAMQAQQAAFLKAMTGGMAGGWGATTPQAATANTEDSKAEDSKAEDSKDGELDEIKKQLAELQSKLSKL